MARLRRSNGEGSIFLRESDGLWVGQIYVNGQRKVKYSKTQKVVRDWIQEQKQAVKDGTYLPKDTYTVTSFMGRYFSDIAEHNLAPRTILSYRSLWRKHIEPSLGSIKLSQLRVDHLQKLYSDKLNEGLSRRTVQYIHHFIHTVLEYAYKWSLIPRNIADLADPPSQEKDSAVVLTTDQAKQLLDLAKIDSHKFYTLYLCAISMGLREGELLALDWGCIDFDKNTLRVEKQLQYIPGHGLTIKSPKTDSSYRTLPLPEMTRQALLELKGEETGLVFHTSVGTPYSPRNILRYFHRMLGKMSLPIMPFHNLRHTCASFHLVAGTPMKVTSAILGHSSTTITANLYSHVLPELHEEAAKRMDTIFN